MSESIIKNKSFHFTIRIVKLYKFLLENKKEYVLSKQVLRSGTAIGALVREAQNAESNAHFIHKLGVAQKENDDTLYWLELLFETEYLDEKEFISMQKDSIELLKMIRSAIITSKNKVNQAVRKNS
ncbi:four helix bundle protein [Ferruginibacter sp.]|uniref:four helix bundle protein n=2 Tax=Ferruginibacter sp. TaxID=1940288 RepID=UPI0026593EFC|nr:four helix bundle protein [Ferruginibacter sp.]